MEFPKVANQPEAFNNVSPIYGSDDRVIFTSDRPRNGARHLYPQLDEYEEAPTVTGLWALDPATVCPGHGPVAAGSLLGDQQAYFQALRDHVGKLVSAKKSAAEIQKSVEQIRAGLSANARISRYVSARGLAGQVEKVMNEMNGEKFPAAQNPAEEARLWHARQHGLTFHNA